LIVVAGNSGGVVFASADGRNWQELPETDTTGNLCGLAYGKGVFVAAGAMGIFTSGQ